jgi:chromosome segregation ATPase
MGSWWGGGPTWQEITTATLEALRSSLNSIALSQKRISSDLRRLMADVNKMQADLSEARASLTEIKDDLNSVRTINDTHQITIAALEATVADLRQQLASSGGDPTLLDGLAAAIESLKTEARGIADIVSPAAPPVPV